MLTASQLKPSIEAVLFMNHKPVSLARLQEIISTETDLEEYRTAISDLQSSFFDESRGIELVEVANGYQLRTKMEYRDLIQKMFSLAPIKMSQAMLEVLAIVAYNQPITKEKVEQIRGVDCSHILRSLMDKKMLRMAGKSDDLGKPMLYGTTKEFLELFGLRDLNALPSLRDIEDMLPANEVGNDENEEEALAREMEGIVTESSPLEFNDLELAELEASDETQVPKQIETEQTATDSNSSQALNSSETLRGETGAEDLQESLAAPRGYIVGPEGNA